MAIAISAEARAYEETVSFHRRKSYAGARIGGWNDRRWWVVVGVGMYIDQWTYRCIVDSVPYHSNDTALIQPLSKQPSPFLDCLLSTF